MNKTSIRATFLLLGGAAFLTLVPFQQARAQGCIVSRSNGEVGGPESEGGYLQPGDFNLAIGYRHQFSFEHYIGPSPELNAAGLTRVQLGSQVENKINLENVGITYQLTSRFSVTADIPILTASRHSNNSPIVYDTQGVGDMAFMLNGWIWNPKENKKGNVQLGVGLLLPSGKSNLTQVVNAETGLGPQVKYIDYSIQPGQGGWGIPFQWAGYKNVWSTQLYFNGTYTAMIQDMNTTYQRSATPGPNQYQAIMDQYLLEAGAAHAVPKVKGLTATFGPRWEGVPARNLFPGDNLGFRRPGFAISIEPGVQYVHGPHVFSAEVGRALYRDRTISVPDTITGGHGDAAFANWVWLASYSLRYSPRGHVAPDHDHVMATPAAAPTARTINN
jgi:hypothetical protein